MVIASFALFLFYAQSIDMLGQSFGEGAIIDTKVSKGTFLLLSQSLDGLNSQQKASRLQQYRTLFGDKFTLAETSTLNLNEEEIANLNRGKVVSRKNSTISINTNDQPDEKTNEDGEDIKLVYFKNPGTSLVWRAELDYNLNLSVQNSHFYFNVEGNKFADGMMYLLQSKLLPTKQTSWAESLHSLEADFGMPLKIIDISSLSDDLDDKELSRIKENKVANITQRTTYATLVKKIPNSTKLLQVGPVEVPWFVRNAPFLFLAAFILSFATTLLIWLWPFWSNLLRIKKAADDFGSGNYNARIPNRWWSPVRKISNAFNAMAEQTQNSIRQQKELTSAVSHELRTPVARMRFALEMLDSSTSKHDKTRFINDINEDIDDLDSLLEELLSYARFDQKNYTINPSLEKLIPWLSNSMEKLMPLAGNKVLHYRVEGIGINETSLFEPRLMTRVLDNLVQNALRYAKHTVEVLLSKDHDNYLLVIEDDGAGIAKDKRKEIFNAFSRIDASRDRSSGGFGLGLAIVDRIVKAHLGNIIVLDSPLGGARFEIRIPAERA